MDAIWLYAALVLVLLTYIFIDGYFDLHERGKPWRAKVFLVLSLTLILTYVILRS